MFTLPLLSLHPLGTHQHTQHCAAVERVYNGKDLAPAELDLSQVREAVLQAFLQGANIRYGNLWEVRNCLISLESWVLGCVWVRFSPDVVGVLGMEYGKWDREADPLECSSPELELY